jgi:hypothetical protein
MNYIPIHTNIAPNYNYLSAENAYLKQNIEYKDAVICEQQVTIGKMRADTEQLSKANQAFKQERDYAVSDAARWRVMKKIILTQGGERQLYEVQKTIDKELSNDRAGKKSMERRD